MATMDDGDPPEIVPAPILPRTEIAHFDPDRRFLGVTEREWVRLAERWWDRTGRHMITAADWRNPDLGVSSGIMRGLPWANLNARERQEVLLAFHTHILIPRLRAIPLVSPRSTPAAGRGSSGS